MNEPTKLRFGVNYTPSRGWFHHWLDFDLDEVRADFDSIAALGLDHLRVFPLWPIFQPNRTLIRPRAIEQLVSLVDAASERDLSVQVDGLQGHLSSFDFLPAWTQTWHRRSLFTHPEVVAAQEEYLHVLASALAGHEGFLGMTVGNEMSQFASAPHPDPDPITPGLADRWLRRMLAACASGAPNGLHVHAGYDATWYQEDHPFTPAQAARLGAATVLHSWVFNGTAQRYGPTGTATEHHAAYLIELSKAWAREPHRPVWLQEVGAPAPQVPAGHAAAFAEATVANAADCTDLWGITWWCSHDVSRALADFPELEYDLGLLTCDRRPKPAGVALARAAVGWRERPDQPQPRRTALVLDQNRRVEGRLTCAPGGTFFESWMALTEDGARPAVVLAERSTDHDYLTERGIAELVTVGQVRPIRAAGASGRRNATGEAHP
ncbi:glycosyl hydrolase [Streptomyces sp. NPDC006879]|uniref:glycoside hydrolase 5 family protein n=1 Tax=Streptomyces sp. NPDC006879 TaxID=3364767 RepID=UPI0036838CF9